MRQIISRYRRRGAHRTVQPGPYPWRPPVDPWYGQPLFGFEWAAADVTPR